MRNHLAPSLKRIRAVLIDVDGVLASRQIIWAGQSEGRRLYEIKHFCVHDGAATWAANAAGLLQAVLSGRDSGALRKRMERMRVDEIFAGDLNKLRALETMKRKYHLAESEIAYIGDDFLDLPIMERVGLPIAVSDATPDVKQVARYVTKQKGGEGAVAEVLRMILTAQGKWQRAIRQTVEQAYTPKKKERA